PPLCAQIASAKRLPLAEGSTSRPVQSSWLNPVLKTLAPSVRMSVTPCGINNARISLLTNCGEPSQSPCPFCERQTVREGPSTPRISTSVTNPVDFVYASFENTS